MNYCSVSLLIYYVERNKGGRGERLFDTYRHSQMKTENVLALFDTRS